MGATQFTDSQNGWSMNEAYKNAVNDANEEHGSDSYNGTISTTSGVIDKTKLFISSKLKINDFISLHIDECIKWGSAWGVCVQEPIVSKNKVKTKVNNIVEKGTKKWILKYEVIIHGETLKVCITKGDAIKWARDYVEKTKKNVSISMIKVLEKSNPKVAEIVYKRDDKEKPGKYVFFGLAAC